ncbi:protein kinase [Paenibacillus athensensis]|uniref:Serine/threonine protein kinase n=1 Tax=Paenibacillus athensensis TaxID=1967502 RepID=A0A4Y8PUI1_9BACL|nr:protein kinase [Paenibacillus athensensis]MCD1261875.1 protein kinase [Paenibacillus athensensis]
MTTWYETAFRPGSQVRGKWNGHVYTVERMLGAGANGLVVLVRKGRFKYALKAGFETVDHQSEINTLRKLSQTETSFKHFLVDVDDLVVDDKEIPFSVMRYIEGMNLSQFLQKNGRDWIFVIGGKLLKRLTELHQSGFVFGDLKIENMLVSGYGDVELVDFGGVTPKGRAIKQLTEVYDRGFWMAGERVAEESYDLFSFAIVMLKALDGKNRFAGFLQTLPQTRDMEQLYAMMRENPAAAQLAPFLRKALQGQIATSQEAYQLWKSLVHRKDVKRRLPSPPMPWLKICFAASLLIFGATLYIFW